MPILQKASFQDVIDQSREALRTGALPSHGTLLKFIDRVKRVTPRENFAISDWHSFRALRLVGALADRMGNYKESRDLLDPWRLPVTKCLESGTVSDFDQIESLLWFVIDYCLIYHRKGEFVKALAFIRRFESKLDRLPKSKHVDLRCRYAYALARHYQSLSGFEDYSRQAEQHYSRCLQYCVDLAAHDAKKVADYRLSITLIGLARIFLSRGELERARQQLLAAKALLKGTSDEITKAFVEFSLGCVSRQMAESAESIGYLQEALKVFDESGHERYYIRCRHELAKAYFNEGNLDVAVKVLNKPPPTTVFMEDSESKRRWVADDRILMARVELSKIKAGSVSSLSEADESRLKETKRTISNSINGLEGARATDVRTRGAIVIAELDLALGHPDEVEASLGKITAGMNNLDKADRGWAWLTIAQARLERFEIAGAKAALEEYKDQKLENVLFASSAQELQVKIDERAKGGLWLPPIHPPELPRSLTYYEGALHGYLLQCFGSSPNWTHVAKVLQVSKNSIRVWRKKNENPDHGPDDR